MVSEGEVLAGKYRVEKVLGVGGMGVVVAARHLQLDQRVALKFLLPDATQNPETLARFAREARAAAQIRGEHVARVIDIGNLETGAPYIVMEYLEGTDLAGLLANRGPLPFTRAAELAIEACDGLAEAHALGIVHRDLKPANLFLARSSDGTECLKILDFGISKVLSSSPDAKFDLTRTGALMGSPLYMAPEQMRSSRAVDTRADIWSMGVILYELVSGRPPFEASTLPELCGMILTEAPRPLGEWRPDLPASFQQLVERCLQKEPAARFQSVGELALALAAYVTPGELRSARSLERIRRFSGAPPAPSGAALAGPSFEGQGSTQRTHSTFSSTRQGARAAVWGGLGAAAVALAGGALLFARSRTVPPVAAEPPELHSTSAPVAPASAAALAATPSGAPSETTAKSEVPLAADPGAAHDAGLAPRGTPVPHGPHHPLSTAASPPPASAPRTPTAFPTSPTPSPLDGRL